MALWIVSGVSPNILEVDADSLKIECDGKIASFYTADSVLVAAFAVSPGATFYRKDLVNIG